MSQDVVEVVSGNETIVIKIGLDENFFDFLIVQILSEILGDLLQLMGGDLSLG